MRVWFLIWFSKEGFIIFNPHTLIGKILSTAYILIAVIAKILFT